MHRVYLIVILFISTVLISDAYDPLDIDFLKKKSRPIQNDYYRTSVSELKTLPLY